MMLTKQEAMMKYCPFLGTERDALPDPVTDEYGVSPLLCRTSHCMAWRSGKLPKPLTIPHEMTVEAMQEICEKDLPDPPRPKDVPESYIFMIWRDKAFWEEDEASCETRRKGYCGLVGLPGGEE